MIRNLALGLCLALIVSLASNGNARADGPPLELKKGDHVVYIGNTMADRMQHHAWLETYLHAMHPEHDLTFRNLGFSGDEIKNRPRSDNFGSADEWLTKVEADVIFCFFGYNEALRGAENVTAFERDLVELIDGMRAKKYNGESAPRLVFFSPIAHEDLGSPHLPDGSENNQVLGLYNESMKKICAGKNATFVDLFTPSLKLYADAEKPLTMNGIHLLDHGNQAIAKAAISQLYDEAELSSVDIEDLREAVLDKNYHWFSRYRVVDGYNVYGGRSKLAWFDQSNADVMRREMEIFDVMTANRDKRIWSIAQGGDAEVDDSNIPELLEVQTNKPGPLEGGRWPYEGGTDAIKQMQIHEGMEVNLFASEEKFPRLVNPVQMAVDTDSRLWAAVWPSYPHWNPTEKREDALLIFPDEDVDGEADECIVFADELNSITGFEFWGGGVLVAAPPEIWFLKDTDGDDKADLKIRMLQGVSSADTHHSANAVLIGPDGWMYWSRGIFNIANFETPTKTHRTGKSGVHRFNPRTFEVEFHFPIGPNPHGDVFDKWAYQFASDGTSGTGSYINFGKGIGNKQWYTKRVRPVPAIGILSSSHFPPEHEGNFLITNAIGFLGVLQHEVKYDGADITAVEIDPIVVSSDPNFRPSDLEVGGDGALYISDWHNTLIGHMQHNMRDPNRDHEHGRIYRVTYKGRDLVQPAKMKGKPISEVCANFFAAENGTRYRARLELSGRESSDIVEQVGAFADSLDPKKSSPGRDEAQALLECLWVFEEHRVPNMELVEKVFLAQEPRVRAAAIRTLGHWAGKVTGWEDVLIQAAQDGSALVRAESVKAAVDYQGRVSAEVIFEVSTRPTDAELDSVLKYAKSRINVDALVQDTLDSGMQLSQAAQAYVLLNASVEDLLRLDKTEAVYRAILGRNEASVSHMADALEGLAYMKDSKEVDILMDLIDNAQKDEGSNLSNLGALLVKQPASELQRVRGKIEELATEGATQDIKRVAYAAWVAAAGPNDAFLAASKSKESLRDFLDAVPSVDDSVRAQLYGKVEPLISAMPANLDAEPTGSGIQEAGIQVDYFYPSAKDVAIETLEKMEPKASGIVPEIVMDVPQRAQKDQFALRFSGMLSVPRAGKYTFFTTSDDGSRIYIDGQLVVNHDGLHGMSEKSGAVELAAGAHDIIVTYFDNGGGDGLRVQWQGPGFSKQKIASTSLSVGGGETLHDVAIRALASIPGNDEAKFVSLASLVSAGKNQPSAIKALRVIPDGSWPDGQIRPLIDNLIGYLTSMPARYRTGSAAMDAVELTKALSTKLSADEAKTIEERLQNLDVRVIAIGTVPHRMIYDKELIVVQAGKPVEFRFSNTDAMPHNFAIAMPGSLEEVGELAEATGRDSDAMERHYIPVTDKILLASRLLQPGESEALSFEAPTEPGIYPYVCTYPGHWRRMYGALYVVSDLEAYQADAVAYLNDNPLEIKDELLSFNTRDRDWTYEELVDEVRELPMGRNFDVGKELFKVASCTGCHKLNDEGRVFGPDLAELDEKKRSTEYLLRSILEPSVDIEEKYQSHTFVLITGKVITGMIVEENDDEVHVVIDPLAKDEATVILVDDIEDQIKSPDSLMPKGLLNRLSREEILDLLAYIYAGGDKENKIFMDHQHDH